MSAAPKFTPGPWGAVSDEFGWCQRGIGYPDGDDRDHDLCVVQCGDPDELEANAHLIAAAPDLYAALRRLADYAEARARGDDDAVPKRLRNISDSDIADAIFDARAALARVEAQ